MSKKQHHHLVHFLGLTIAGVLLCFPRGLTHLDPDSATILPAIACGALALSLAHLLLKLGPLPAPFRVFLLLPLAVAPHVTLLVAPGPLTVLFLLLPFSLVLQFNASRLRPLPTPAHFAAFFVILGFGAFTLFQQAADIPSRSPPRLPSHSLLWLSILAVIPLGLASRAILRPLAKALFRCQVLTLLTLLALYPLIWTVATSFKVPGETEIRFHDFKPQPRFFTLPGFGIDDLLPSELRKHPRPDLILRTVDEMSWRLGEAGLRQAVPKDAPLPAADMIRAMKLYGFLLEDRHGPFVPGESFTRSPPPQMKEEVLPWFRHTLDRVVVSSAELAELLSIPPETSRDLLLSMRRMNLVARVPGDRFRLTAQARHPFENNLYPRQILAYIQAVSKEVPEEIETWTYSLRWELSYPEVRRELGDLVDLDIAIMKAAWKWNQHADLLLDSHLWRYTAIWITAFLLALLIAKRLPLLTFPEITAACLLGILLTLLLPLPLVAAWNLRLLLGLWLLRSLLPVSPELYIRLCLFAATLFFANLPLHTLHPSIALVHQSAWISLWTPLAVLSLLVGVRRLKIEEGRS